MSLRSRKVSSIAEIRAHLATAVKSWNQQTSDLTWPEGDSSMAAMDVHMLTLRAINRQLALIETLSPNIQKSLAVRFDAASVQDPGEFAQFAKAVGLAAAA